MKTALTLLIAIASLAACSTTKPPVAVLPDATKPGVTASPASGKPIDAPKKTVEIPSYLLVPCSPLEDIESNNPSPKDVLKQKARDSVLYKQCRDKDAILIKIVKDAFNLK